MNPYYKSMRYFLFLFIFVIPAGHAQDHLRFKDEITAITTKYDTLWDASKASVVFTGSSSIRIWNDLQKNFPSFQIVNSGFGGSQASDLLAYTDELILRFNPIKVFIYEGDNDISNKKRPKEIIDTIKEIIAKIRTENPSAKIVLIAAKPSMARWSMKRRYKNLNRKFNRLTKKDALIQFADVWNPMLNGRKVKEDIFIQDGLHMNDKGYGIWYSVIKPFMEE